MPTFKEEFLLMNFIWRFTVVFCEGRNKEAFECLSRLLKSGGIRFSWQNAVEVGNTANKNTVKKRGKRKLKKCSFTCVSKNMIFFVSFSLFFVFSFLFVFYSLKLQFSDQGSLCITQCTSSNFTFYL